MVAYGKLDGISDKGTEQLAKLLVQQGPNAVKYFAILFAVGLSNEQVSRVIGYPEEYVVELRNSSTVVDLVLLIQTALSFSPEKRIALAVQQAIDVKLQLLARGDDKTKNSVSTEFLDRHLGKPLQTTQSLNVNLNASSDAKQIDGRLAQLMARLQLMEDKKMKLLKA